MMKVKWNRIVSITIMLILAIGIISTWGSVIYKIQSIPPQPTTVSNLPMKETHGLDEVNKEQKDSTPSERIRDEQEVVKTSMEDGLTIELLEELGIMETNIPIDQLLSILNIK